MANRIIVSQRDQNEIEDAIDYYALNSADAPANFITVLKEAYLILEKNPFIRIRYKNIRALKLKSFPYSLYFVINEKQNTIKILSCFHNKRNPNKKPAF